MTKWLLVHRTAVSGRRAMRSRSAGLVASILIVDDHAAIRRALRLALSASPDLLYAAKRKMASTPSAKPKAVARSDCFGLAYASDGRSGGCAELKRLFPQIPLMMLTCYHSSAAEREAKASGVSAVFSKPEGMQNLIWHARAVLMAS